MATLLRDLIKKVFLRNGFTIKDGQEDLKPYVYNAGIDLINTVQQTEWYSPDTKLPDKTGNYWIFSKVFREPVMYASWTKENQTFYNSRLGVFLPKELDAWTYVNIPNKPIDHEKIPIDGN